MNFSLLRRLQGCKTSYTPPSKYKMKRLGFPEKFLTWHMQRSKDGSIHISRPTVARKILTKTGMLSCEPKHKAFYPKAALTLTPNDPNIDQLQSFLFHQTIGDLRYPTDSTRPDIHPAFSMLAYVMHKPARSHKNHFCWLLCYLSGTKSHGILFKSACEKASDDFCTYTQSDFANDKQRRSRTGIAHMFQGALVS